PASGPVVPGRVVRRGPPPRDQPTGLAQSPEVALAQADDRGDPVAIDRRPALLDQPGIIEGLPGLGQAGDRARSLARRDGEPVPATFGAALDGPESGRGRPPRPDRLPGRPGIGAEGRPEADPGDDDAAPPSLARSAHDRKPKGPRAGGPQLGSASIGRSPRRSNSRRSASASGLGVV